MKGTFYRKRVFLNPVSSGHTSYVLAEVESTRGGEYKWGTNMLTIADCKRRIQLEFFLGTKKARKESLTKINLLISTLIRFGHTLLLESQAIDRYEQDQKKTPKKKIVKKGKK